MRYSQNHLLLLKSALGTRRVEFCNMFRRCLIVSEKLSEHYLHDRIVFRVIFFFVLSFSLLYLFIYFFLFSVFRF